MRCPICTKVLPDSSTSLWCQCACGTQFHRHLIPYFNEWDKMKRKLNLVEQKLYNWTKLLKK